MKIYERFRYGIFDCDGTLIDSIPTYNKLLIELLKKKYKIPIKNKEKFTENFGEGISFKEILLNILQNKAPRLIAKIESMMVVFFEHADKQINYQLFPNTEQTLDAMFKKGMTLFISTACVNHVVNKKTRDIKHFFKYIMSSEKIPKSAAHIEKFIELTGDTKEEFCKRAFFVGDTKKDMEIAKECGIYAIGITNTVSAEKLKMFGANAIIKDLSELLEMKFPESIFDTDIFR
ncbi:MAG: HAD hydrolase-like protein [Patescibacteria group bacterium]